MPNVDWNEENIELLKKHHAAGWSGSQIATKIPYATRGAVMGKIDRLGLSRAAKSKEPPKLRRVGAGTLARLKSHAAHADPGFVETAEPSGKIGVSFAENTGCQWPLDRGTFCGMPKTERKPYCAAHARIAVRKPLDAVRKSAYKEPS